MFQARFRRRIPSTWVKRVEKAVNKAVGIARGPKVPAEPEETSQAEQATAEMEAVQAAIQNGQELTARVARILAYRLADRIEELEAVKVGLDDELASAEAKATQVAAQNAQEQAALEARIEALDAELSDAGAEAIRVATQNDQARTDFEARIEVLKAEKTFLGNQLSDAKFKAEQVSIQNNRSQVAYEARIEELKSKISEHESDLIEIRSDFEEIKSTNIHLESDLRAEKSKANRASVLNNQDKDALRRRIDSIKERSFSLERDLSKCESELRTLKDGGSPEDIQAPPDAAIEAAEKPLADAWRLFHKQEPTYAFVEAIRVLECDLRQALGHTLILDGGQPTLYPLLEMATKEGYINTEQFSCLDRMRMRRNDIIHGTSGLDEPEAHDDLGYLEQVIDQLGLAKAGTQDDRDATNGAGRPRIGGVIG